MFGNNGKYIALVGFAFFIGLFGAAYIALNRAPLSTTKTEAADVQSCNVDGGFIWNGAQCPPGYISTGLSSRPIDGSGKGDQAGNNTSNGLCCVPLTTSQPSISPQATLFSSPTPFNNAPSPSPTLTVTLTLTPAPTPGLCEVPQPRLIFECDDNCQKLPGQQQQ